MLKVKEFHDTEAFVVGYNWNTLKSKQSLRCRLRAGDPSSEFSVTVSNAVRSSPPAIGDTIVVKYFEMTKNGVPRFPTYKGPRADAEAGAASGPSAHHRRREPPPPLPMPPPPPRARVREPASEPRKQNVIDLTGEDEETDDQPSGAGAGAGGAAAAGAGSGEMKRRAFEKDDTDDIIDLTGDD